MQHFGHLVLLSVEHRTVKPVLHGHPTIDKTKILMTYGSLMNVESILQGEHSAIFLTKHLAMIGLGNQFSVFLEWPFYTGFTVYKLYLYIYFIACLSLLQQLLSV